MQNDRITVWSLLSRNNALLVRIPVLQTEVFAPQNIASDIYIV